MLDAIEDVAVDATSGRKYVGLTGPEDPDELVEFCREVGATYRTGDGEMFVVRFPYRHAEPYTERALRASIKDCPNIRPR